LDALSEFLFKYPPYLYEQGRFAFAASGLTSAMVALLAGAVLVVTVVLLRRLHASRGERAVLLGLRALAVAVLAFCLLRPVLVVSSAVPSRNVVAVLVDDSRSMRIADAGGATRAGFVRQHFASPDSALYRALAERFQVRFYRTSGRGGRSAPLADSSFAAGRSQLVNAAIRVQDELVGTPVAGVVLVSDGADNASEAAGDRGRLMEQLVALKARGVPVFTIGVGSERFERDIEVVSVAAPRSTQRGGNVVVEAVVMHRGFGGRTIPVIVEDSGRIVAQETVTLPRDGEAVTARIRTPASAEGARRLTVRVPLQDGELIDRNNARAAVISVRGRREKILYVEGEPRFEIKFLRRAVAADSNLQLVTMVRTARDKYLRLSVDDSLELAGGFPRTREELFGYRAIVLGSIEASAFSLDQLRMLADFVSERGGGLLALGGRLAFGEGGYRGTPLADVLPVEMVGDPGEPDSSDLRTVLAVPTDAGRWHAALPLAADSNSRAQWDSIPAVTTLNRLGRPKPGATVLLNARAVNGDDTQPLLAVQRFGRGRAAVFGTQDSWMWQMAAEVAVEDESHETFWRQLLRWLVTDVPDRADMIVSADAVEPNESVRIRAEIFDERFVRVNGARIEAELEAPDGARTRLPFEWSGTRDGEYVGDALLGDGGLYVVHARAILDGAKPDTIAAQPAHVVAASAEREYFAAERRAALLQQLAQETGGRYYEPGDAMDVARDLSHSASGVTVVERKDLWDLPALYLLLALALAGEWAFRRRRGFA
jgi:uncharacterized membrane protein